MNPTTSTARRRLQRRQRSAESGSLETTSSLPGVDGGSDRLHVIFHALCLQRMKQKHDQQVPEWGGERHLDSG